MGKSMRENLLAILIFSCFAQHILVFASLFDYDAYVVNGLPDNKKIFWVHIFSGDDDLGFHNLKVGEKFFWHFKMAFKTEFYGHFWWGDDKERGFAVFDRRIARKCRLGIGLRNVCWWLVKEDGFYIANMENASPADLIKMNWWINRTST